MVMYVQEILIILNYIEYTSWTRLLVPAVDAQYKLTQFICLVMIFRGVFWEEGGGVSALKPPPPPQKMYIYI